ncbi:MAG: hypothetical protein A2451_11735 [Bdellovibrionales bacterium RIFOXYC2_FULL_39_8]|nr:MAG: hypothetical protein A2385_14745 [Bdellovibrionales bacterium RIFOXYB1_FULL_39_21]OFZ43769.1 MAG: hypothetical protein A2485_04195 [Bdellovibrionales bacterium RIFOXYC12_FULL_39_17]OFZ47675.1 MAG: hypothetical protein A2404_09710 [Bdellovibrionales bacterium RIFOXYC1_FULL_39_130]OFZ69400.1 MAG: hypothetical protein A2451_11735 [Bdellovibrionales bacterium RIFOXYC2_FULL_39_8]OFZ76441.1 MAG: hypothetical protein A2560_17720 [Bdellovibrionales bacterium RIFOXYD1_FULL_39_84]
MEVCEQTYYGRLGKSPQIDHAFSDRPVCYLSVAVNSAAGTEWKQVVVTGTQADLCPLYLRKGAEVFIRGVSRLREYTSKSGERRQVEVVYASSIGFTKF